MIYNFNSDQFAPVVAANYSADSGSEFQLEHLSPEKFGIPKSEDPFYMAFSTFLSAAVPSGQLDPNNLGKIVFDESGRVSKVYSGSVYKNKSDELIFKLGESEHPITQNVKRIDDGEGGEIIRISFSLGDLVGTLAPSI